MSVETLQTAINNERKALPTFEREFTEWLRTQIHNYDNTQMKLWSRSPSNFAMEGREILTNGGRWLKKDDPGRVSLLCGLIYD